MSGRAFISFDKAIPDIEDDVRAQVIVKTGTLPITEVRDGDRGVAKVIFDHEAGGMEYAVTANVLMDSDAYTAAKDAAGTGREVAYRIETRRKDGISRKRPFPPNDPGDRKPDIEYLNTQGKGDKNDVIAALVRIDDAASAEALTDPAEDSKWSRVARPDLPPFLEQRPGDPASSGATVSVGDVLTALANARKAGLAPGVVDVLVADALKAGASVKQVTDAGVAPEQSRPAPQKGFAREGKAWEAYNSDGRINLGGWSVGRAQDIYTFVHDLLRTQFVESMTPEAMVALSLARTKLIMNMGDKVQVGAYGGGRPDRTVLSHRYSTDLIMESIKHRHPFPTDRAQAQEWEDAVVTEAVELLKALAAIAVAESDAAPQQAQAPAEQPRRVAERQPEPAPQPEPTPEPEAAAEPVEAAAEPEPTPEPEAAAEPVEATTEPEPAGATVSSIDKGALLKQLADIAVEAGFTPSEPGNPVSVWMKRKFGVDRARDIESETLVKVVDYYSNPSRGPALFYKHVMDEVAKGDGSLI